MDVSGTASGGFHPPSGYLLLSSGTSKLPAENPVRRNPFIGNEASVSGRDTTPSERVAVPTHVCYQPPETSGSSLRYVSPL